MDFSYFQLKQQKYSKESHIFLIFEVQHNKKCLKMLYEYHHTKFLFFLKQLHIHLNGFFRLGRHLSSWVLLGIIMLL